MCMVTFLSSMDGGFHDPSLNVYDFIFLDEDGNFFVDDLRGNFIFAECEDDAINIVFETLNENERFERRRRRRCIKSSHTLKDCDECDAHRAKYENPTKNLSSKMNTHCNSIESPKSLSKKKSKRTNGHNEQTKMFDKDELKSHTNINLNSQTPKTKPKIHLYAKSSPQKSRNSELYDEISLTEKSTIKSPKQINHHKKHSGKEGKKFNQAECDSKDLNITCFQESDGNNENNEIVLSSVKNSKQQEVINDSDENLKPRISIPTLTKKSSNKSKKTVKLFTDISPKEHLHQSNSFHPFTPVALATVNGTSPGATPLNNINNASSNYQGSFNNVHALHPPNTCDTKSVSGCTLIDGGGGWKYPLLSAPISENGMWHTDVDGKATEVASRFTRGTISSRWVAGRHEMEDDEDIENQVEVLGRASQGFQKVISEFFFQDEDHQGSRTYSPQNNGSSQDVSGNAYNQLYERDSTAQPYTPWATTWGGRRYSVATSLGGDLGPLRDPKLDFMIDPDIHPHIAEYHDPNYDDVWIDGQNLRFRPSLDFKENKQPVKRRLTRYVPSVIVPASPFFPQQNINSNNNSDGQQVSLHEQIGNSTLQAQSPIDFIKDDDGVELTIETMLRISKDSKPNNTRGQAGSSPVRSLLNFGMSPVAADRTPRSVQEMAFHAAGRMSQSLMHTMEVSPHKGNKSETDQAYKVIEELCNGLNDLTAQDGALYGCFLATLPSSLSASLRQLELDEENEFERRKSNGQTNNSFGKRTAAPIGQLRSHRPVVVKICTDGLILWDAISFHNWLSTVQTAAKEKFDKAPEGPCAIPRLVTMESYMDGNDFSFDEDIGVQQLLDGEKIARVAEEILGDERGEEMKRKASRMAKKAQKNAKKSIMLLASNGQLTDDRKRKAKSIAVAADEQRFREEDLEANGSRRTGLHGGLRAQLMETGHGKEGIKLFKALLQERSLIDDGEGVEKDDKKKIDFNSNEDIDGASASNFDEVNSSVTADSVSPAKVLGRIMSKVLTTSAPLQPSLLSISRSVSTKYNNAVAFPDLDISDEMVANNNNVSPNQSKIDNVSTSLNKDYFQSLLDKEFQVNDDDSNLGNDDDYLLNIASSAMPPPLGALSFNFMTKIVIDSTSIVRANLKLARKNQHNNNNSISLADESSPGYFTSNLAVKLLQKSSSQADGNIYADAALPPHQRLPKSTDPILYVEVGNGEFLLLQYMTIAPSRITIHEKRAEALWWAAALSAACPHVHVKEFAGGLPFDESEQNTSQSKKTHNQETTTIAAANHNFVVNSLMNQGRTSMALIAIAAGGSLPGATPRNLNSTCIERKSNNKDINCVSFTDAIVVDTAVSMAKTGGSLLKKSVQLNEKQMDEMKDIKAALASLMIENAVLKAHISMK